MVDEPILHFAVDQKLLKRIDAWRFKNEFATRSAAIRWLLDWALNQKPQRPKEAAGK